MTKNTLWCVVVYCVSCRLYVKNYASYHSGVVVLNIVKQFHVFALTSAFGRRFGRARNRSRTRPQSRAPTQSRSWTGCPPPLSAPVHRPRLFARLAPANQTDGITNSNGFINHPISRKLPRTLMVPLDGPRYPAPQTHTSHHPRRFECTFARTRGVR